MAYSKTLSHMLGKQNGYENIALQVNSLDMIINQTCNLIGLLLLKFILVPKFI